MLDLVASISHISNTRVSEDLRHPMSYTEFWSQDSPAADHLRIFRLHVVFAHHGKVPELTPLLEAQALHRSLNHEGQTKDNVTDNQHT